MKRELTHGYLLQRLYYNPETGIFTWKERPPEEFKPGNTSSEANCKSWNKKYAEKVAGTLNKEDGYVYLSIDKRILLAHRIAYFYYHGYLPENQVDHKDRIRHHNWIDNLREASRQCNSINTGMISTNTSGVKGVGLHKQSKKYQSKIMVNQKTIFLGLFKLFDDAVKARWEAEVKYKFPNCCTSSSSYNYLKDNCLL